MFSALKMLSGTRYLVRRLQTRFVMRAVSGRSFETVADIGAGKAPYKKFISCKKYIGVDVEDRGGVPDVLIEDINLGLSLANESVDLVLCTEVLEHVKKPAFVLKELHRILKKDGMLVLTTPMVWPVHEAPNDYFRYTNFGLEYLAKEAGFDDVTVCGSNGYFYSLCQLSLLRLRHAIFIPIVLFMNAVGFLFGKFEKNTEFPLGQQMIARKKQALFL